MLRPCWEKGSSPDLNFLGPFLPGHSIEGVAFSECLLPSHGKQVLWGSCSLLPVPCLVVTNTRTGGDGRRGRNFHTAYNNSKSQSPIRKHPRIHKTQSPQMEKLGPRSHFYVRVELEAHYRLEKKMDYVSLYKNTDKK